MSGSRLTSKMPFEKIGVLSPENWVLMSYQALHRILEQNLQNFVGCSLAGGAVRDAMVGKTPKDLDILLHISGEGCEYAKAFQSLAVLAEVFSASGWYTEIREAYNQGGECASSHFQECYTGLLKIRFPDGRLSADILVVQEHLSIPDAVRTFDSNLTRVFMQPDGVCFGIAGEHPRTGLVIDASCRESRILKHVDFWREYYHDPLH